tara:strand:- start:129 stop:365 length:237 start_codon:yes stop_codon:yes gene_type:complete
MIAKDIEKGDFLEKKIDLKDEQILNLQTQVHVRDSVIMAERGIKKIEMLANKKNVRRRSVQSFAVGGTTSILLVLLIL